MDRKERGRIKEGEMDGWVWVYSVNVAPFS